MSNAGKPRNYSLLRSCRTYTNTSLKQLYILTGLSISGLKTLQRDIRFTKRRAVPVEVVSGDGIKLATTKRKAKIRPLINEAINSGLYKNALVSAVTLVEEFIHCYLHLMLSTYPQKVGKERRLGIDDLLKVHDKDDAVQLLIEKEILAALYKSPRDYLDYFENILSIDLPLKDKRAYIEVKATRDLLVHNGGIVNSVYLEKTGNMARAKLGDLIPVTQEYFDDAFRALTRFVNSTFELTLVKHGDSIEMKPNQPMHPTRTARSRHSRW